MPGQPCAAGRKFLRAGLLTNEPPTLQPTTCRGPGASVVGHDRHRRQRALGQRDARNINRAFDASVFNTNPSQQLDRNLRTLPSDFGGFRNDAVNTLNAALLKNTSLGHGVTVQLRAETFNAFDRVQFASPVMAPTNANFGRIISQVNAPRSFQFAIRMMW